MAQDYILTIVISHNNTEQVVLRKKVVHREDFLDKIKPKLLDFGSTVPVLCPTPDFKNEKCFLPSGVICLEPKDAGIYFFQNGIPIFGFDSSKIEIKLYLQFIDRSQLSMYVGTAPYLRISDGSSEFVSIGIQYSLSSGISETSNLDFYQINEWKRTLKAKVKGCTRFIWTRLAGNATEDLNIFLEIEDAARELQKVFPELELEDLGIQNDFFVFTIKDHQIEPIPIQSFMCFSIKQAVDLPLSSDSDRMNSHDSLRKSFQHQLSATGCSALNYLKTRIWMNFKKWDVIETSIVAPISSLSQGSGSGKSKLSVELTKEGPGFYVVLRSSAASSGYPANNGLSSRFKILCEKSDPLVNLEKFDHDACNIGKILMLLAKILTVYMHDWFALIRAEIRGADPAEHSQLARTACAELSRIFDSNDCLDDSFVEDQSLTEFILSQFPLTHETKKATVNDIAGYIKEILDDPSVAIIGCSQRRATSKSTTLACIPGSESTKTAAESAELDQLTFAAMKSSLNSFPFIFILDEAEQLNDLPSSGFSKGFEHLRRALSYLRPTTKIFFLSLGTRSTVIDLNPTPRDDSGRYIHRKTLLDPIVLLSNTSIFTNDKCPIENLKITPNVLKNPVFFKFLVTLGHPLWSSCTFDSVIELAKRKIVNGSEKDFKYVLVLWMIRAGLQAHPFDINTRSLIASHMATLFDLSPDLSQMLVFYPSEPILAIACRKLVDEILKRPGGEQLFSQLNDMVEAVQLNRGHFSEVVGSMAVLRAIDLAAPAQKSCMNDIEYEMRVEEIKQELGDAPEFDSLWSTKQFVLEPEKDLSDQNVSPVTRFPDYHVVTVESFLKNLLSESKYNEISPKLPYQTLKGLVNASHTVKLFRNGKNLKLDNTPFPFMDLPAADNRIPGGKCNIIDDALLKLGLVYQCCFSMPENCFGFDIIVPVLLENGQYTFIGIQLKSGNVSLSGNIEKMPARFHYVKCALAGKHSEAERIDCPRCMALSCQHEDYPTECQRCHHRKQFAQIYGNQISLLISVDANEGQAFRNEVRCSANFNDDELKLIKEHVLFPEGTRVAANGPNSTEYVDNSNMAVIDDATHTLKQVTNRANGFKEALVSVRETANPDDSIALISNVWYDGCVELEKVKLDKNTSIDFVPDGYLHRQYCIAIRGMDSFQHLFIYPESIENAKKLLEAETDFLKRFYFTGDRFRQLSYLKAVLYDANVNYYQTNYALSCWRNWKKEGEDSFGHKKLIRVEKAFLQAELASLKASPELISLESVPRRSFSPSKPVVRHLKLKTKASTASETETTPTSASIPRQTEGQPDSTFDSEYGKASLDSEVIDELVDSEVIDEEAFNVASSSGNPTKKPRFFP